MKLHRLASLALLTLAAPVWAATPASGTLTEESGPQTFTGGPYILPTPGGIVAGSGVECEVPTTCDEYALTVTISEKFRADKKNEKEVAQIIMTPSNPLPIVDSTDIDLYLLDSSGAEVASSTGGTAAEAINIPLKALKDGAYTVRLITGLPVGTSESVEIRIGRGDKAALTITPMVAAPGEAVQFDASSLGGDMNTGYNFDFGDGATQNSDTGKAEHTYIDNGVYLARVTYTTPGNSKAQSSAAQSVVVESVASAVAGVADKSGTHFGGAFGFTALLAMFGLALARRRV